LLRRSAKVGADSDVPPDIGLAENALGGLSAALGQTNDRIAQIARKARDRRSGVKDYRALIEALQERARRLRERIAAAIELYERYARALVIDELEDRRSRLEAYLQQARLELAKTYDIDTDLPR
jgi:chromosome segregation ATPase